MGKKKTINILTIIIVLSLFVVPLSYAILKSAASASKSIVLAEWSVTLDQSGENNYLSIIPDPNGTTADYTLHITSQSQVDTIYSVVINNIPSGVHVAIDGVALQVSDGTAIASDVGTILYSDSDKTRSHTVTFSADSTATYTNNSEININVIARQALNS